MARRGSPELDALMQSLRGAGKEVSVGGFTLDRDKAREKMRTFQLADPRRYVLELVRAAVLKGATRVEVTLDADDLWVRFDGTPFTLEDFDQIYGALFVRGSSPALDARRALALGLNAAMALDPRHAIVRSGDGKTRAELVLRPERPDAFDAAEPGPSGTEIHVKERFRPGLVNRYFSKLSGELAEDKLLRQHCAWSRVPILLNGTQISRGHVLGDVLGRVKIASLATSGTAGFLQTLENTSALHLVMGGVLVTTQSMPSRPGFAAVVEAPDLELDVSRSDVVQNAAYTRLLNEVERAQEDSMIELAGVLAGGTGLPAPVAGVLLARLRNELFRQPDGVSFTGTMRRLRRALADAPLFRLFDGQRVSLARLIEAMATPTPPAYVRRDRFAVGDSAELLAQVVEKGRLILFPEEQIERHFLVRVLGKELGRELEDLTESLQSRIDRELARRAWQQRRTEPRLPTERYAYVATRNIEGAGFRGQIGIRAASDAPSLLWLIREGCLLGAHMAGTALQGLEAAIEGDFTPNDQFNGAVVDEHLIQAVRGVIAELPALHEEVALAARTWDASTERVRRFLALALDRAYPTQLLQPLQLPVDAERHPQRLELGVGRYPASKVSAMAKLPLFAADDRGRVSLAQLEEVVKSGGMLEWVDEASRERGTADILVLRLDVKDRKLLTTVFGDARFHNAAVDLRKKRLLEAQPVEPARLPRVPGSFFVSFRCAQGTGELRFQPETSAAHETCRTRLLRQGRLVGERPLVTGLPRAHAVVDSPALRIRDDQLAVVNDDALAAVQRTLHRAGDALLRRICALLGELPEGVRRDPSELLWSALYACVLPPPNDEMAFMTTHAAAAPLEAAFYFPGIAGDPPHEPVPPPTAPLLTALRQAPLLRQLDGQALSVDDLAAARTAGRPVYFVELDAAAPELPAGPQLVFRIQRDELGLLERLLGEGFARPVSELQEELQHQRHEAEVKRQLETREQLPDMYLDPASTLVSCPLVLDGADGHVGFGLWKEDHSQLTLCRDRRVLATITRPGPGLVVHVNDDRLTLDVGGSVAEDEAYARVLAAVDATVPALLQELLFLHPHLDEKQQALAFYRMIQIVGLRRPGCKAAPQALDESPLPTIAALPGFTPLEGAPLSLNDLAAADARDGEICYLPAPAAAAPDRKRPAAIVADEQMAEALRAIFPNVQNLAERVAAQQNLSELIERGKNAVPPRGKAAVAESELSVDGWVIGRMWIPRRPDSTPAIRLTWRGFETGRITTVVPCGGELNVAPDSIADVAAGRGPLRASIEQMAVDLHVRLADSGWHKLPPKSARLVRKRLADAMLAAHRADVDGTAELTASQQALLDRLRQQPLLTLGSERYISLDDALERRPPELRSLGLWGRPPEERAAAPEDGSPPAAAVESAPPEAAAPPAPEESPPPPPPSPEERLLESLRSLFRQIAAGGDRVLEHLRLSEMRFISERRAPLARGDEHGVALNLQHPAMKLALAAIARGDHNAIAFIASAMYTACNIQLEEITDDDEHEFQVQLTNVLAPAPPR